MARGEQRTHHARDVSTPSLRVTVTPDRLTLAAGGQAVLEVEVRNVDHRVQHLGVRVQGLPDGATYDPTPPLLKLPPGATGAVTVRVALPDPPPPAGTAVLGVVCASTHDPDVSACEEVRLTVAPAPGVTATFVPSLVTTRRHGRYVGTVTNTGNTHLVAAVHAQDPESRLRVRTEPARLELPPGARGHVVLTATAPTLWTGQERRHALAVTTAAPEATAEAELAFVQRPRLPAGALRTVGAALGVATLGAAVVVGLDMARGDDEPAVEATAAVTDDAAGEGGPTPEPTAEETTPEATPEPTPAPTEDAPPATEAAATAAPDAAGPQEHEVTFDDLPPGAAAGAFDGVRISPRGQGACAATTGLVAEDRGGDVVLLAAAAGECVGTPLLVLFPRPAQDVVLRVPDDGRLYRLQVEDSVGATRTHTVQAAEGELPVPATRTGVRSVELAHTTAAVPGTPVPLALSGVSWEDLG